jgi:hypothetical protein
LARARPRDLFLHGLLLGLVNSVWITSAHVLLFNTYMARHAQEVTMMQSMPFTASPRLTMAMTGPVVGLISGVVIGMLTLIAGKLVKRPLEPTGNSAA